MIGALWILLFTIIIGLILYILDRRHRQAPANPEAEDSDSDSATLATPDATPNEPEQCCGLHLVCEKDSLSPMSDTILYYDDEELDRFIGRDPESFSPEETEEFRDVLMTLRPEDIPGWARSVTQRRLPLPPEVRDELLLLVNDLRNN